MRFLLSSLFFLFGLAAALTTPPKGALIVRQSGTKSGEYKTVSSAVKAAGTGSEAVSIFIYPGTYKEQVYLARSGTVKIYGYTSDSSTHASNQVVITYSLAASAVGGDDDKSGTLRIHQNNVAIYNVDIKNTFGHPGSQNQAIAASLYGNQLAFYGCKLISYQDTLLTEQGTHFFGKSYIEGAVDYIFGQYSQAYFYSTELAHSGPGALTASGRFQKDSGIYVFNKCKLTLAKSASSSTNNSAYLGRPWGAYARVVIENSDIGSHINAAGWEQWSSSDPRTGNVEFGEYANTGAKASMSSRKFATKKSSTTTIAQTLGSNYANWVDPNFSG